MDFKVGQRWISNSEAELGLGIIAEIGDRQIILSFPAAQETRAYSKLSAPLTRIIFRVGEELKSNEDIQFTVLEVTETDGLIKYSGKTDSGDPASVMEWQLNSEIQFQTCIERLVSGQVDKNKDYELRVQTLLNQDFIQRSALTGLLGNRTELLPHQIYIAHEVANRFAPRVMLSDEVGLGKTIEAGMIIHHQVMTGQSSRVLIILPESLVHQWFVEMLRRFNLHFSIFDQDRYQTLLESSDLNPFESEQLIITTLSLITEHKEIFESIVGTDWDLVIVDEAHHIHWKESEASKEYQYIEAISHRSKGLLLLTATPEQAGIESHYARLKLLDPHRYPSLAQYKEEYQHFSEVNQLVKSILGETLSASVNLDPKEDEIISESPMDNLAITEEQVQQIKSILGDGWNDQYLANPEKLIDLLLDRYGPGRSVFRNRREVLGHFSQREPQLFPLMLPEIYQSLSGQDQLLPESHIEEDVWLREDPRVAWLEKTLKELKQKKVLVICHRSSTAQSLDKYLNLYAGIRSTAFYEGLSLVERDRAAAYFAEEECGARVLICSEIGSEGRNFQFAHHIVLFDLPLNPDLIEQRIGRLDRIGQQQPIQILIPYMEKSSQEVVVHWYNEGLNQFTESCSAGYVVYEEFASEISEQIEKHNDETLSLLIAKTRTFSNEVKRKLEEGQNALLALSSCRKEVASSLIEEIEELERGDRLKNYIKMLFDCYGLDFEQHSSSTYILRPTDHMRTDHFPGITDEAVTVTLSREKALKREDFSFLTWEHPIVSGAMEMVMGSELGNATVSIIKLNGLPPGTLMLEAWFSVKTLAERSLKLDHSLPTTPVRYLIDVKGRDLTSILSHEDLNKLCRPVKRNVAQAILNNTREQVNTMVQFVEEMAKKALPGLANQARNHVTETLQTEIERLQALKKINSDIRKEEIENLVSRLELSHESIDRASLVLQAAKVIVTSDN